PEHLEDADARLALPELRGTRIGFDDVRRGFPTAQHLEELSQRFGFVFSPALRAGKQIELVVNGKRRPLVAPQDPLWSESKTFDVQIGNRTARVRAGIKASNDKSGRRGMSFGYGHRIIITDESD